MARSESGWDTPIDGWYLSMSIYGCLLLVFDVGLMGAEPPRPWPIPFGAVFLGTGFLFCGIVPLADEVGRERSSSRLASWLLRRAPRPTRLVRALAFLACAAPIVWLAPWELGRPWFGREPITFFPTVGVAFLLLLGGVVRTQDTGPKPAWWDYLAPWLLGGMAVLYATAALWYDGYVCTAAMGIVWFTHLIMMRQAATRHWAAVAAAARAARKGSDAPIRLEAYSTALERPEPKPIDPDLLKRGPVHVDTGGFRVDASKMVEKLRERQLADPGDFILAWLRCAVASDAKHIVVTPGWRTLRLAFDGRLFSEDELTDPYRALLDSEAQEAVRGAQLAYGLLGALRFDPAFVWVMSGPRGQRVRFSLAARGAGPPEASDPGQGTVLEVGFRGIWPALSVVRAALKAYRSFGLSPASLWVAKMSPAEPFSAEDDWTVTEKDGWRLAWRPRPGEVLSRLRVFHFGALVEEFEERLGEGMQIEGALSHPDLKLSLSQSSVVRDKLFKTGLDRLFRLPG